jgi:hypothetical protein
MQEQNSNTEKVDFRFVATEKPSSPRISAAKWLRSHKTEVLDFLTTAMKHEIIADNDDATPAQIYWAKVESAAFHRYMAEALAAQIAVEKGAIPEVADSSPAIGQLLPFPSPPPSRVTLPESPPEQSLAPPPPEDEDDDWDDDDFEMTITLPAGCK